MVKDWLGTMTRKIPEITWHRLDLEKEIAKLIRAINQVLSDIPSQNTRTISKLNRWIEQYHTILEALEKINEKVVPRLKDRFGFHLNKNDLVSIALFQPSTKNVFQETLIHFQREEVNGTDYKSLEDLASLADFAKVLALLGDAVIDMAILHHLWLPRAVDVGRLTQARSQVVSNEHLATICDELHLYDNRIHFDPRTTSKSEMNHIKGTLIEAIFGVVYIERGFKESVRKVTLLMK